MKEKQLLNQKLKKFEIVFAKEKCTYLGKIIRAHGIHGQLVLNSTLPLSIKNFEEPILVELDGGLVPFFLKKDGLKTRDHQSFFIHFDHIKDKEKAEQYVGSDAYLISFEFTNEELPTEQALLKNYAVYDEQNQYLSTVSDIIDFSGNVLLQIFIDKEEVLLPFTEEHIIELDNINQRIKLQIPEGLLEIR